MRAQRWSHALFSGASLPVQEALGANWFRWHLLCSSGSTSLPCGQLNTGTGCPHRLWCLLLGHLQNPPGRDVLCVAQLEPGGWTRRPTEVPSNFNHSLKQFHKYMPWEVTWPGREGRSLIFCLLYSRQLFWGSCCLCPLLCSSRLR